MARRWRGTTTDCVTLISLWADEGWRRRGNESGVTEAAKNLQSPDVRYNVHYVPVQEA
jgi:hypothetical protein